jgi:prolyl 4-hydroxylase
MGSDADRTRWSADSSAAQFTLARDLLSAKNVTQEDSLRAVGLIENESKSGNGEATALRALFDAMGICRPRNWQRAFDTLQLAAEQGSSFAGRQLLLLSDSGSDFEASEQTEIREWATVRRGISLERLLSHPERQALHNAPRIRIMEGFASAAECRWLIGRAKRMLRSAMVIDDHGRQIVDPNRTNEGTHFQLGDMDVVIEILRARIAAATNIPVLVFEPTQVLHYYVGQEFKRHLDYLEPDNPRHREQLQAHGQRIATFLIYLNEDFEGGETEFSQIGLRYRGKTGDAIFWANCDMEGRPDPMTLHAGLPPLSGEKWILSQWIRDRLPSVP